MSKLLPILIVLFAATTITTLHYKHLAESNSALLQQEQQANKRQAELLINYQKRLTIVQTQLQQIQRQAEQRQRQLDEVLHNEQNKIWANTPIPDDVRRLFKQRGTTSGDPIDLPADNGLSSDRNRRTH